jgi:hypothetical protein
MSLGACRHVLIGSLLASAACLADPEARCMLETPEGACLRVLGVEPSDSAFGPTSNVDAFQGVCEVPQEDGSVRVVTEPFTDHSVSVRIENVPPIYMQAQPSNGPAVTFDRYELAYSINACPFQDCPELSTIEIEGPTITVPSGTVGNLDLPLVPVRTKREFVDGGASGGPDSYTATITMHGRDLDGAVELQALVEFTMGSFSNCASVINDGGLF